MSLLLLFLAQLLLLCQCERRPDYTPLLQFLDKEIKRELEHPLEGRGSILLENVETYNSRLVDCRDMVQQRVYEAYVKAAELQKMGGPQFLKADIDEAKLKEKFNWSEAHLKQLQDQFDSTKSAWKEVEGEFKEADKVFKIIKAQEMKDRAEQAENEQKRIEKMRQAEEEFSKKVTVNIGPVKP